MENDYKIWSLNGLETSDVKVHNVYDGDTFKLILPICCSKYIFNCRLNNIDTPEIRSKNLKEKEIAYIVRDYVRKLLQNNNFRIKCLDFDKYGRVLCDILLENDESLSEHLIKKNYAYEYTGGTKKKFNEWYHY